MAAARAYGAQCVIFLWRQVHRSALRPMFRNLAIVRAESDAFAVKCQLVRPLAESSGAPCEFRMTLRAIRAMCRQVQCINIRPDRLGPVVYIVTHPAAANNDANIGSLSHIGSLTSHTDSIDRQLAPQMERAMPGCFIRSRHTERSPSCTVRTLHLRPK